MTDTEKKQPDKQPAKPEPAIFPFHPSRDRDSESSITRITPRVPIPDPPPPRKK